METETIKLLQKEFNEMQCNPNASIGCTVGLFDKSDLFNWKVSFLGPKDSPYAGGIFFLKLMFPNDYPNNAPQINFLTPIYHLNVCPLKSSSKKETLGNINEKFINYKKQKIDEEGKDNVKVKEILTKLYAIFYNQDTDPNYVYGIERSKEYSKDIKNFELKAKYFTEYYAGISNLNNEMSYGDKDWNFSTNKYYMKVKNYLFGKVYKSNIDYNSSKDVIDIKLLFNVNGIDEHEIKCKLGDKTKDVIQKVRNELGITDKSAIYIFDLRRLDLNKSIGANGLNDNLTVTIISDYHNI
jgi:ubiquitin-protein ligase